MADRLGVEVVAARAVEAVLLGSMSPEAAVTKALTSVGTG
jgi:hypothetical protein